MEIWNIKYLRSPPLITVKTDKRNFDTEELKKVLQTALSILDMKSILHKEAAVLSRLAYRLKTRYRGHMEMKYLGKVNCGLRRYLTLDLQSVFGGFYNLIYEEECGLMVYLPTKQILESLLVRIQGFSKIMCYIMMSCQDAGYFFLQRIQKGHTWKESTLCFALLSRIWYLSKYYILCACTWYSQLCPYLERFIAQGPRWLPDEYKLPDDLLVWLQRDLPDGTLKFTVDNKYVEQTLKVLADDDDDIGEIVDRDDFASTVSSKMNAVEFSSSVYEDNQHKDVDSDGDMTLLGMQSSAFIEQIQNRTKKQVSRNMGQKDFRDSNENFCHQPFLKPILSEMETFQKSNIYSDNNFRDDTTYSSEGQFQSIKPRSSPNKKSLKCNRSESYKVKALSHKFVKKLLLPDVDTVKEENRTAESKKTQKQEHLLKSSVEKLKNISDVSNKCTKKNPKDNNKFSHPVETIRKSVGHKTTKVKDNVNHLNSLSTKQTDLSKVKCLLKSIKNVHDVKVFLRNEKKARVEGKECITRYIKKNDWKLLVTSVCQALRTFQYNAKRKHMQISVVKNAKRIIKSYIC